MPQIDQAYIFGRHIARQIDDAAEVVSFTPRAAMSATSAIEALLTTQSV